MIIEEEIQINETNDIILQTNCVNIRKCLKCSIKNEGKLFDSSGRRDRLLRIYNKLSSYLVLFFSSRIN